DGKLDVAELVANQLVAASRARLTAGGPAAPAIDGVADTGETVRYDLPILRGVVAADTTEVSVRVGGAAPRVWPAADRRLKVLVPLEPGQNYVSIRDRGAVTYLALRYTPQTNPRKVRFVYALASDGDGSFDAPPGAPRDLATATRRVALGARLLQAMMADRLDALGYGRRTFRVDTDPATGAPAVTVWRTSATTAAWRAMSDAELFSWVWQHQGELPACGDCKTVVMLGMTHWDPAQNKALAHTALGGGGVALFGTGTLYSWADALDDVVARLSDDRTVASLGAPLFDDSGYRGTLWANYATGLGAVLHELGHALDLPHPTDDAALLNRGFDHVNRLVMVSEPASNVSAAIPAIWPSHEPFYVLANGARLRWHRWLALDAASYTVNAPPAFSRVGDEVRVDSPAGIRAVSYRILVSTGPTSTDWRVAGGEVQLGVPPARWVVNVASL
ncbi:MAG: hypothetical protein KC635_20085, partial [Myxococcales bacterium]|nr:hypothetical protein [Myxococcales bacterium]